MSCNITDYKVRNLTSIDDVPETCLQKWTLSAVECYLMQGKCSECIIMHTMETPCNMDFTVKALIKKFGKPTKQLYERLLNAKTERFVTWK